MNAQEIKARLQRDVDEAWLKGNLDVADELYAQDIIHHAPPNPDFTGIENLKQQVQDSRNTYPDLNVTLDDIFVDGDTAIARWTFSGTHTGQSAQLPIPPTGKQVNIIGCTIFRFENGKVAEMWFFSDNLGFMQQLGVIPAMEQSVA